MTVRRKIGEATTVHERNVESAIGRVPEWHRREANYTPLVGGLMNQNWLVEIAGDQRRYFIKVPGEGSEMFIDLTPEKTTRFHPFRGLGLPPKLWPICRVTEPP